MSSSVSDTYNFQLMNVNQFIIQLNEIVSESQKIRFAFNLLKDSPRISENSKFCKKIVKDLFKEIKYCNNQLDTLIKKVILVLGNTHQKFYRRLFIHASSIGLQLSCKRMVDMGVLVTLREKDVVVDLKEKQGAEDDFKDLMLNFVQSNDGLQRDYILRLFEVKGIEGCCQWLFSHMRGHLEKWIDSLINFGELVGIDHANCWEVQINGAKFKRQNRLLFVLQRYFPGLINFLISLNCFPKVIFDEVVVNSRPKKVLNALHDLLDHSLFEKKHFEFLVKKNDINLGELFKKLDQSELVDSFDKLYKIDAKWLWELILKIGVMPKIIEGRMITLLESLNQKYPEKIGQERFLSITLQQSVERGSIEVLNFLAQHFSKQLTEFLNPLPCYILRRSNPKVWQWVLEQLPNCNVNGLVDSLVELRTSDLKHFNYFIGEAICADLIRFFASRVDGAHLESLIAYALGILLGQSKIDEAKEAAALMPDIRKRFEESLKIDLIEIPILIAEMSRSTLASDDPKSPAYLVEERLKHLFAHENHVHLDKALPQLLANPIIVNYLLNSRGEKLGELLSLQDMPEDTKRIFLPLLPPTEMVDLIKSLSLEEKDALLQIPLVTSLIEGMVSARDAILLCQQNWVPKIHGSRDEADTYMPMVAMFYRALPFPTLAAAASLDELQEGMIQSLQAMYPVQQAVVIPQLDAGQLLIFLRRLPLRVQAVLLGMCTREQKIKYLQEFEPGKLASEKLFNQFSKKKAEIEEKFASLEKKTSENSLDKLTDLTSELYTVILSLRGGIKNALKENAAVLVQLNAKLAEANELSFALITDITLESQIDEDIKQLEKAFIALEQKLGIVSERDAPEEYLCMISHGVMDDPVIAADNHLYDRKHIQKWFDEGNGTSPCTRKPINSELIEDLDMKVKINAWRELRKSNLANQISEKQK